MSEEKGKELIHKYDLRTTYNAWNHAAAIFLISLLFNIYLPTIFSQSLQWFILNTPPPAPTHSLSLSLSPSHTHTHTHTHTYPLTILSEQDKAPHSAFYLAPNLIKPQPKLTNSHSSIK